MISEPWLTEYVQEYTFPHNLTVPTVWPGTHPSKFLLTLTFGADQTLLVEIKHHCLLYRVTGWHHMNPNESAAKGLTPLALGLYKFRFMHTKKEDAKTTWTLHLSMTILLSSSLPLAFLLATTSGF